MTTKWIKFGRLWLNAEHVIGFQKCEFPVSKENIQCEYRVILKEGIHLETQYVLKSADRVDYQDFEHWLQDNRL